MRILMITLTYPPSLNGVAISTQRTVEELRRKKHAVTVIMPKHPQRKRKHPADIEVPSVANPIQKDYPVPVPIKSVLLRALKNRHYDIVHFHQPMLIDAIARAIARDKNIPLVFTYHTRYEEYAQHYLSFLPKKFLGQVVSFRIQQIISQCDALIATTRTYQNFLTKTYHTPVYYVSTAGLNKVMKVKKSKSALRKLRHVPLAKTILINVSRQVPEKNLELILKTLALLPSSYYLVMIGGGVSAASLKELARALGIEKRVLFTGAIPQNKLSDWYSLADFFVYSSMTDTIGINILEAMSAGLPVFAIKDPNVEEVVKHNVNGLIIHPSAAAFSEAIQRFPQQKYASFSKAAAATANQFLISHTTDQLIKAYKTTLAQKHV